MFYPFFQTPRLSLHRNKESINIFLSDGRLLLQNDLPPDTPEEEIIKAALSEITFLVFRDLVDLVPLLKPYNDGEYIILPMKVYREIRYAAFLRGKIPFIRKGDLKKVCRKAWPHVERQIQNGFPERFPGKGKVAQVISCDWACMVAPEPIHEDIYAAGKYALTSTFDHEYLYKKAEELDIIIDTIPRHPLEMDVKQKIRVDGEKAEKNRTAPNGLPLPPSIPPSNVAADKYGRMDLASIKEQKRVRDELTFNKVRNRILQDSKIPCYKVGAVAVDRHQYMSYIAWAVSEGTKITEICKGINGMPSLLEVYRWRQMYPDFALDLTAAEEIQAQVYADRALDIAEKVEEKDEIPVAKFKHRALMDRAALQAEKFRQKQVIQTEDLDHKNVNDLKRQLKTLLQGNVAILQDVIDVEMLGQAEGQQVEDE